MRQGFLLWRNHQFGYLVSGQWLSQVGSSFFSLAVFWYVLDTSHSVADLGLVGSVLSLPGIVGLVSGVYADRIDRRSAMIASDLIRALLAFVIALLAYLHSLPLALLLPLLFALELAGTLFLPSSMALIPTLVKKDDLAQANGIYRASSSAAALIGALGGGAVMAALGPVVLFFANGVSFVLSVISLGLIRVSWSPPERREEAFKEAWLKGFHHLWHDPLIRRLIFTSVAVNVAMQAVMVLLAAWVKIRLHGSAFDYGLMEVAYLVGLIVGSFVAPLVTKRIGMTRTMVLGLLMTGVLTVVVSRIANLYLVMLPFSLIALSSSVRNTAFSTELQLRTPAPLQGRVFGTLFSFSTVASPVGAALAGEAAAAFSLPAVYLASGLVVLIASTPLVRFMADDQQLIPSEATSD